MLRGIFVKQPANSHYIYHLSDDDDVALCGRHLDEYECMGESQNTGVHVFGGGRRIGARRCCEKCQAKAREQAP